MTPFGHINGENTQISVTLESSETADSVRLALLDSISATKMEVKGNRPCLILAKANGLHTTDSGNRICRMFESRGIKFMSVVVSNWSDYGGGSFFVELFQDKQDAGSAHDR